MALSSRLAIIVGGIGGIGAITAKALHSQGARLALLYAPFEAGKVTSTLTEVFGQGSEGKNVRTYECDVTSPAAVEKAFSNISADDVAFPSILVNSAGYVKLAPLEHHSSDDVLRHFMVNLFGPTLTGQAFTRAYVAAKDKVKQKDPQRSLPGGRIVNISSQAAHVALHQHGAYCASKAGVIGLTKCMASEWGPLGITANSISPGPIWTELGKKAWADEKMKEEYRKALPTGRFGEPEEVARIVSFLCQDQALNINGADIRLDGGYTIR